MVTVGSASTSIVTKNTQVNQYLVQGTEKKPTQLIDFFDRLYIIHLPERVDRYRALRRELAHIGINIDHPKVIWPDPVHPADANGFYSIGWYCNFLRHYGILKEALKDGLERVWILEDDAMFRRSLRSKEGQERVIRRLSRDDWDLCFLGHGLEDKELRSYQTGLPPCIDGFTQTHCYCVHARVLPKLVAYLEETLINPPGHPRGGRLPMDGAFNMFRRFHPETVTLISNPILSGQQSSPSSLGKSNWFDRSPLAKPFITAMRSVQDEVWRRGA